MSEPDRLWQAEIVQLHDGYVHFLRTNRNSHLSMCIQGIRGGKQKLILARHSIPVDAKEQYAFPTALKAETISASCRLNVKHMHDC